MPVHLPLRGVHFTFPGPQGRKEFHGPKGRRFEPCRCYLLDEEQAAWPSGLRRCVQGSTFAFGFALWEHVGRPGQLWAMPEPWAAPGARIASITAAAATAHAQAWNGGGRGAAGVCWPVVRDWACAESGGCGGCMVGASCRWGVRYRLMLRGGSSAGRLDPAQLPQCCSAATAAGNRAGCKARATRTRVRVQGMPPGGGRQAGGGPRPPPPVTLLARMPGTSQPSHQPGSFSGAAGRRVCIRWKPGCPAAAAGAGATFRPQLPARVCNPGARRVAGGYKTLPEAHRSHSHLPAARARPCPTMAARTSPVLALALGLLLVCVMG